MAESLLNKVINQEIPSSSVIKWLQKASFENNEDFSEIYAYRVSQIDFVTFFLNFIHDEAPCSGTSTETPQKFNTPKRIEKRQPSKPKQSLRSSKTNLFPSEPAAPSSGNNEKVTPETPTTPKIQLLHKNDNYFSPVSPLYEQANHSSINSHRQASVEKQEDKYSLCLGDFLVSSSKNSVKKKKKPLPPIPKHEVSKRIKPTTITLKQSNSEFETSQNSFNFQQNAEEKVKESNELGVVEQRNLIAEERLKILARPNNNSNSTLLKRQSSLSRSDIKPMLDLVTYKSNINHVVNIYKSILRNKLILNLTSELYFLVSLIVSKQAELDQKIDLDVEGDCNLGVDVLESNDVISKGVNDIGLSKKVSLDNSQIFETIHNVVYFAVKVLESQAKEVKFYDKTTIRLLVDNERIKEFSPDLSRKLAIYTQEKTEKPSIELPLPQSQTNVCFNIDTDNKENFPDMVSFQAFRKQRDMFYEILRIWETQHLTPEWNFSLGLAGKIRSLLNLHVDPSNLMHLARLFKNQLLSSCAKGPKEKGLSENDLSFLPSLSVDADKLRRLTNRLVTKEATNGINTVPTFSGYQEFFKEFIVVSCNYSFSIHLKDCFSANILELNDAKFHVGDDDIEEDGHGFDPNTRKVFVNCIRDLRILAKFLGFLESIPYKSDIAALSGNVVELQIEIRRRALPALDIKSLLHSAIENHTLVYLIPWLTKYLSMLDYVTLRLPYFTSLYPILFDLYRNFGSTDYIPNYNSSVVTLSLGWLFELPNFPDMEYFNYCSKTLCLNDANKFNGVQASAKAKYLDFMPVVDQSVLYLCCPYLEEIKKLMSSTASNNKVAVKFITPVTAAESSTEMVKKKVEQQLEEAFFSGQPTSLRKTVEFVSERVASMVVKHICHNLVPKAKEEAIADLISNVLKTDNVEQYSDDNQRKTALKKQANLLAQTHLAKFLLTCEQDVQKISRLKIPVSIDSLLPIDTLEETKKVCSGITNKMCTERVKQWLGSHVNATLFTKDFDTEIHKEVMNRRTGEKKKAAFSLPAEGRDCNHNESALSGFHALNNIREACCKLRESRDVTPDFVLHTLRDTFKSLTDRNDVNDMIISVICATTFDFYLLLAAEHHKLLTEPSLEFEEDFLKIWMVLPVLNQSFKTLFSPRNVKILHDAVNRDVAWDLYAKMVSSLLDKKIMELEELESQCTGFYNKNWDTSTLDGFSHFLKRLVAYSGSDGKEKFAFLLNFLSDFCSDL